MMTQLDQLQYSVHHPPAYICTHLPQLLPQWSVPVRSVLVMLQPSGVALNIQSPETEAQKQALRGIFLDLGYQITQQLKRQGYWGDLFDPKTGQPLLSKPGSAFLDDVAVVRACLGYPCVSYGGCLGVLHPRWGDAVYPSILVSSASPEVLHQVMQSLTGLQARRF